MPETGKCKRCGKEAELVDGLCDDCYVELNEAPGAAAKNFGKF